MTLASVLAHVACTGSLPVPGVVHDPTQPLVLGNQGANDYCVFTWDAVAHRLQIQSVYQPPGGGALQQATLTFAPNGQFLINGQPLSSTPEFASFLAAVQASAAAAAASQTAAAQSASNSAVSASSAGTSATASDQSATLSQQYANAPPGTELPGGGNSAAVSVQEAANIAQVSRDLDLADPVIADETFESGFLFTERPVEPVGGAEVVVTIPPGIFSSVEKRARWGAYKLRSATGSVRFVGAAGGTNLVTPTLVARGRTQKRYQAASSSLRQTLVTPITVPAITDGELVAVFNAQHNGTANATTMNFTYSGASLTWETVRALPANARAVTIPDWFVVRTRLVGFPGAALLLNFDEGVFVHFQACDWFILEGVDGLTPISAFDTKTSVDNDNEATLPALPAQSLALMVAAQGANETDSGAGNISTNLSRLVSGNTNGAEEIAVLDSNTFKNQVWQIASGVALTTGDFEGRSNWEAGGFRGGVAMLGYRPKSVIGGGTVNMQYEAGRQSLTVPYGTAELWFQPDGSTVHVKTPNPAT